MSETNGNGQTGGKFDAILERVAGKGTKDPALSVPGAPPNYGRDLIPHVLTFQGILSSIARVYRPSDEALRDSYANARFMRNDCSIMECVEQRQRSTALLDWHLEAEDKTDPAGEWLCNQLTAILKRTPRFMQYRETLLGAIWYGRAAVRNRYTWEKVDGRNRVVISAWSPVHGDKLVFKYDDGTGTDADQVGLRVGAGFSASHPALKSWVDETKRAKILPTDYGLAYFLEPYERDLLAIHRHQIEDGEYEDPQNAGRIHGVGIRSRIYWTWFQKQEALAWLMEYLERSGFGIEIWYYPSGNPEAKAKTREAAEERIGQGRNIILVPRPQGDQAQNYGVERIEPGMAGANMLQDILTNYFGHQIKRYILGQTLTTEATSTGLGSNLGDIHMATYLDIIRYDATNLEETMATECVDRLKQFNFPQFRDIRVQFKIHTDTENLESKLQAWRQAYEMGAKLKARDVYDMIGAAEPGPDDETLSAAQQQQALSPPPSPSPPVGGGGAPFDEGDEEDPPDGPDDPGDGSPDEGGDDASMAADGLEEGDTKSVNGTTYRLNKNRRWERYAKQLGLFDEEDHPRADDGKFSEKPGSGAKKAKQGGLFDKSGLPDQMNLFADTGVPDDLVGEPKAAKPAQKATYRWLARQLFDTMSFGSYSPADSANWAEKAKAVVEADRTPLAVHNATLNFKSMHATKLAPGEEKKAKAILDLLEGREFMENLPKAEKGQARAKKGGEIGPNGEPYKGGAFIATTDMPKRERQKLEGIARRGRIVHIEPGTKGPVPEGKISIFNSLDPHATFKNQHSKEIGLNYPSLKHYKTSPEQIAEMEGLVSDFNSGTRFVDYGIHPDLLVYSDMARLAVDGKPIPGDALDRMAGYRNETRAQLEKKLGIKPWNEAEKYARKPAAGQAASNWDEAKHPRADDGKFGEGGGGTANKKKEYVAPTLRWFPYRERPGSKFVSFTVPHPTKGRANYMIYSQSLDPGLLNETPMTPWQKKLLKTPAWKAFYDESWEENYTEPVDMDFVKVFDDDAFGITGTGHAKLIFNTVSEALKKRLVDDTPTVMIFTAKEPSRSKLYRYLVNRLGRSVGGFTSFESQVKGVGTMFFVVRDDKVSRFTELSKTIDEWDISPVANVSEKYARQLGLFDESKHPRAEDGKFGSGPGTGSGPKVDQDGLAANGFRITDYAGRKFIVYGSHNKNSALAALEKDPDAMANSSDEIDSIMRGVNEVFDRDKSADGPDLSMPEDATDEEMTIYGEYLAVMGKYKLKPQPFDEWKKERAAELGEDSEPEAEAQPEPQEEPDEPQSPDATPDPEPEAEPPAAAAADEAGTADEHSSEGVSDTGDATEIAEKIRTYGYDSVKMSDNLTDEQLQALEKQLTDNPDNANPTRTPGGDGTINLYNKATMKKIESITWARYYLMMERKKQRKKDAEDKAKEADRDASLEIGGGTENKTIMNRPPPGGWTDADKVPEYPKRTADTMSDAIAVSSPSGKTSKRAKEAAQKKLSDDLFGEGGLAKPTAKQETEKDNLLRNAKQLREMASRGLRPRANVMEAKRLEEKASEISGPGDASAKMEITPRTPGQPFDDNSFARNGDLIEGRIGSFPITTSDRGVIAKVTKRTKAGMEEALSDPAIVDALKAGGIHTIGVVASNQSDKGAPKDWTASHYSGTLNIHPRTVEAIAKSKYPERVKGGLARVLTHEAGHGAWNAAFDREKTAFTEAIADNPDIVSYISGFVNVSPNLNAFNNTGSREVTEAFAEIFAMKHYDSERYDSLPESVRSPIDGLVKRRLAQNKARHFQRGGSRELYKQAPIQTAQPMTQAQWDESKHKRAGKGTDTGGQFTAGGDGGTPTQEQPQPQQPAEQPQQPQEQAEAGPKVSLVSVRGIRFQVTQDEAGGWHYRPEGNGDWIKVDDPNATKLLGDRLGVAKAEPESRLFPEDAEDPQGGDGEAGSAFKEGDTFEIPAIGGANGGTIKIFDENEKGVGVGYADGEKPQIRMPRESLKHFVNDLSGIVEVPPSRNNLINAVADGKAEFLGKGDDGVVFAVGDKVVKVSTTVPYVPMNPGHRTPEEAMARLHQQVMTSNGMRRAGVPGLLPTKVIDHGDKSFAIRDKLHVPKTFTPHQLDQVRTSIKKMHEAGYSMNDQIQVGIHDNGNVYHFDTGKADRLPEKSQERGFRIDDDMSELKRLYKASGEEMLPFGEKAQESIGEFHEQLSYWADKPGKHQELLIKNATLAARGLMKDDKQAGKAAFEQINATLIQNGLDTIDGPGQREKTKVDTSTRKGQAIHTAAQDYGVDPGHLSEMVDEIHGEQIRNHQEREQAKASARKITGLTAGDVARLENAGFDYTSLGKITGETGKKLRQYDVWAQEVARQHPGLIGDADDPNADFSANLWEFLKEGAIDAPSKGDSAILRTAAERLQQMGAPSSESSDKEELVPFAKRGMVEKYSG